MAGEEGGTVITLETTATGSSLLLNLHPLPCAPCNSVEHSESGRQGSSRQRRREKSLRSREQGRPPRLSRRGEKEGAEERKQHEEDDEAGLGKEAGDDLRLPPPPPSFLFIERDSAPHSSRGSTDPRKSRVFAANLSFSL